MVIVVILLGTLWKVCLNSGGNQSPSKNKSKLLLNFSSICEKLIYKVRFKFTKLPDRDVSAHGLYNQFELSTYLSPHM